MKESAKGQARMRTGYIVTVVAFIVIAAAGFAFFASNKGEATEAPVSFSMDIVPMFVESCTACHGGENPSAQTNLEAEYAYDELVNVAARFSREREDEADHFMRVMPGVPEASYLMHKLLGTHIIVGGSGQQMPRGDRPAWTDEQIDLVRQWILAGAPNN